MAKGWETCAYTAKVVKFCRMMTGGPRKVILYSGEENDTPCDEHVQLISEEERSGWFGPHDENDLDRGGFSWATTDPWWLAMNVGASFEILKRQEPQDHLLLIAGHAQKPIADALNNMMALEWGVGYEGIFSPFCAFESSSWMHWVYGKKAGDSQAATGNVGGWDNGRYYDEVIPNFFDVAEFPDTVRRTSDGYLLFVGRLIERKGVHIAAMISERTGIPLKVAGPGAIEWGDGFVTYGEGRAEAPGLEYVGVVGIEDRAELMHKAAVTLVPTTYIEPFGGVAVEAMMAGCPVVASDWGAFRETVRPSLSGYRFRTLAEGATAVEKALTLNRWNVRDWAHSNYSLESVRPMFNTWFDRLDGLWNGPGWNA